MRAAGRRRSARTSFALRVRPRTPVRERGPVLLAAGVYGVLSLLAVVLASAGGRSALVTSPWLPLEGGAAHAASLALGLLLATVTVRATRAFVGRYRWARELHAALRPSVRHASTGMLLALGVTSAVGEELFFRGWLSGAVGLVLSSVGFGLLHQMRGRGRWAWAAWATVMGLLFGAVFFATGSLLGPVVAHAVINVQNLRFLRDTDVGPAEELPRTRRLGGLLGRA